MVAMSQQSGTSEVPGDYAENGRTYGGYRSGKYLLPVDDEEQDRLDIFHNMISIARKKALYSIPDPPAGSRIIDLGAGTGFWAIEVADKLHWAQKAPESIIGLDLSLIQPGRYVFCGAQHSLGVCSPFAISIPPTVKFVRADVEDPWQYPEQYFDFVHMQMMLGSVRDWQQLYNRSFRHLKPGGFIEQVEIEWVFRCDDNTLSPNSPLRQWGVVLSQAMRRFGAPIDIFDTKAALESMGFTNFNQQVINLPINPWVRPDEHEEELGRWFNLGLTHGLQAMTMAPFTRYAPEPWTANQVNQFVEVLKQELCRLSVHAYCRMYVWTAQKPIQ
ncbi:Secondary metabolism regulator LAE1 [Colletotrichum sp. SAR11_240]|nr:Secondary metabolism regulator LAE1 [Colletotrichum sp. SAR11_240]